MILGFLTGFKVITKFFHEGRQEGQGQIRCGDVVPTGLPEVEESGR